jgi:hypothetical protein
MADVKHILQDVVEVLTNFPAFRWLGTCSCGFQTRMSTKEAAESQLNSHLLAHGATPAINEVTRIKQVIADKNNAKGQVSQPAWNPFAK